jgi:hypothetical protein
LIPDLHEAPVLLLRTDEQLHLVRIVAGGFLDVHMLPRLEREDRRRCMPVIGCGDHEGVDILVIERASKVTDRLGGLRDILPELALRLGENGGIDVTQVRDFGIRRSSAVPG